MPSLCQSHPDLTRRLSLKTAGPDLDRDEPVLSCLNLVSFPENAVMAELDSRVASWTVLRTCDLSKNADPGGGLIQGIREDPGEELLRS